MLVSIAQSLAIVAFSGGIYVFLKSYASSLRHKLIQKQTIVKDIPFLGISRPSDRKIQGTAIICGGSISGLAAARVCHDHFERVVIVEPEAWLATEGGWKPDSEPTKRVRVRVLQYQALSATLASGFMALEKMFPNLRDECQKAGIRIGPADFKFAFDGSLFNLGDEETRRALPNTLFATRHGLETLLRRLVIGNKQYPNIEQIIGTVTGVLRSEHDPNRLQGVSLRTYNGETTLPASLVIDCSGPSEAGSKWLRRAGFGSSNHRSDENDHHDVHPLQKLKVTYNPHCRSTHFQYHITPALAKRLPIPGGYYESTAIYTYIPDGRPDGLIIGALRSEADTLQVACSGRGDTEIPRNLDEIISAARNQVVNKPIPEWFFQLLDELHEVEASVTATSINFPPLTYIRYHQALNLPSNWIAIGDSVMKVNPMFGQGCSKAIVGAVALNTALRSLDLRQSSAVIPPNFSKLFFEAQASKIEPIWDGSKTLDYGYTSTVPTPGDKLSDGWFKRWYGRRLNMISSYDHQTALALWNSIQLTGPATDLFKLGIISKVLLDVLRRPIA